MATTIDILLRILKSGDGLRETAADSERLQAELKQLNQRFNEVNVDMQQHAARLKETSAGYADAAADAKRLEAEYDRLSQALATQNQDLDRARTELRQNEQQVESLSNELEQLYQQYTQTASAQDQNVDSLNRLESEMEQVESQLAQAAARSDELRNDLAQLEAQTAQTGAEFNETQNYLTQAYEAEARLGSESEQLAQSLAFAESEASQLSAEMDRLRQQGQDAASGMERLENQAEQTAAAMTQMDAASDKAAAAAKNVGESAGKSRLSLQSIGESVLLGFGIGTGTQIIENMVFGLRDLATQVAEIGTEIDFQTRKIATTGASEGFLANLIPQITEADSKIGRLSSETLPTLYAVLSAGESAGVNEKNVIEQLTLSSDAALAGGADLQETFKLGTSIISAYGAENLKLVDVYDLLFTAVNESKLEFSDFDSKLASVTAISGELGLSLDNVTAAIATMNNQGLGAAESMTSTARLLDALSKEGKKTADIFKEETGKSFREFVAEGGTLAEAMQVLEARSQRTGESINDMFSEIRAGRGALLLTGEGANEFARQMDVAQQATGAMEEAAAKFSDSMLLAERQLEATKETGKILLAEVFEPLRHWWIESRTAANEDRNEALRSVIGNRAVLDILRHKNLSLREYAAARMAATREDVNAATVIDDQARAMARATIAVKILQEGFTGTKQELIDLVNEQERFNQIIEAGKNRTAGSRSGRFSEEIEATAVAAAKAKLTLEDVGQEIEKYQSRVDAVTEANGLSSQTFAALAVQLGGVQEAMDYVAASTRDGVNDNHDYAVSVDDIAAAEEERQAKLQETIALYYDLREASGQAFAEGAQAAIDTIAAFNDSLSKSFVAAFEADPKDGGFFTRALDSVGDQIVMVGGRTQEQNDRLEDLEKQYEKTAKSIQDYEAGVKGASYSDERRSSTLEDQRAKLEAIGQEMETLQAIQGTPTPMFFDVKINKDSVTEALFSAISDSDISMGDIATIGLELGQFNDEAAEGAAKAAAIEAKIASLVDGVERGIVPVSALREEMSKFVEELDQADGFDAVQGIIDNISDTNAVPTMQELSQQLVNVASDAGLSVEQLALLGDGLGIYSDEVLEAALQTALVDAKVKELVESFKGGQITVSEMREELRQFRDGLLADSDLDSTIQQIDDLNASIAELPTEYQLDISTNLSGDGGGTGFVTPPLLKEKLIPELQQLEQDPVEIKVEADVAQATEDTEIFIKTLYDNLPGATEQIDAVNGSFETTATTIFEVTETTATYIATLEEIPDEVPTEFDTNASDVLSDVEALLSAIEQIPTDVDINFNVNADGVPSAAGGGSNANARYYGGSVMKGQPVIVGDGPGGQILPTTELFIPDSHGYIMNGRELARVMASNGGYGGATAVAPTSPSGDMFLIHNHNERAAAIVMADVARRREARISRAMGG